MNLDIVDEELEAEDRRILGKKRKKVAHLVECKHDLEQVFSRKKRYEPT